MTNSINEQNVFRNLPAKSLAKSDITNDAARAIIHAEAARQHAKTKRLREARLAFADLLTPGAPEKMARVRGTARKIRAVKTSEQRAELL